MVPIITVPLPVERLELVCMRAIEVGLSETVVRLFTIEDDTFGNWYHSMKLVCRSENVQ